MTTVSIPEISIIFNNNNKVKSKIQLLDVSLDLILI